MHYLTDVKGVSKSVPAVEREESKFEDGIGFCQIYETGTVSLEAQQLKHHFLKPPT